MQDPLAVLLAWSGGKDSTLTLEGLRADPAVKVIGCITAVTPDYDRVSMHGFRRSILWAQIAALGLPLIEPGCPPGGRVLREDRFQYCDLVPRGGAFSAAA